MEAARKTTITNVHVFDGENVLEGLSDVVFTGTQILGIYPTASTIPPNDVYVIDGTGCTLLPGLIDSHVHVNNEGQLTQLAIGGVTTALDMASWPPSLTSALRKASVDAETPRCALLSAGLFATGPGSTHSKIPVFPPEVVLTSAEQADAWVAKRVDEGSDYIKLVCDVPGPAQDVLNALVNAATKAGKKTVAHAAAYEPFRMAVESGCDCITHVPKDQPVDIEWAKRLVKEGRVVCPTLIVMKTILDVQNKGSTPAWMPQNRDASETTPKPHLSFTNPLHSVRILNEAGVGILVGTDANTSGVGAVDHGKSMHEELKLLQEAGMDPVKILRSATSLPAQYWGIHNKGLIRSGARADLILVRGQPHNDITHTSNLEAVWIGGRKV